MAFAHIDPATKVAAVKHYWLTGNLKGTAEKFRVSRNSIYDWILVAEQHLENAFATTTPGRRTATPAEQNQKLQSQLDVVLEIITVCHSVRPILPRSGALPNLSQHPVGSQWPTGHEARRPPATPLVPHLPDLRLRGCKKTL